MNVKWSAVLFSLFILTVIILADVGKLGMLGFIYEIPYGDKAGHFILYGILTLLIDLALFRSLPNRPRNRIAVTNGLILAVLISLEEFSQRYFATRTFSLVDLGASYLGVIFFSWLALRVRRT